MNFNLKEVFQPKFFGLFKKGHYDSKKFTSDLIAGLIVGTEITPSPPAILMPVPKL